MNHNTVFAFTIFVFLAISQPAWAQDEIDSDAGAQGDSISEDIGSSEHSDETGSETVTSDFDTQDPVGVEVEADPAPEPALEPALEPEVDAVDKPGLPAEIEAPQDVVVGSLSKPEATPTPQVELDLSGPVLEAPVHELSESDVLKAVKDGQAVRLSEILPDVRIRTGGEIIDAHFREVGGILVYGVTVLTPNGKVSTEYYKASSGQHVDR